MIIIAYILIAISWLFIIFGLIAIFSLKNLYARILSAATIDTVGTLLLLIGLMFASEGFEVVLRLILLIVFLMITGPISSHVNIRSAYLIGIPWKTKDGDPHA
ncbi:MAG: monovalent cation/H(+) antiporter subunit G [Acholeplasmataceae bacterium]|nr:monovalent cation/H(+) antiporter subunit G [Acholeplasmataceae bacterium]